MRHYTMTHPLLRLSFSAEHGPQLLDMDRLHERGLLHTGHTRPT